MKAYVLEKVGKLVYKDVEKPTLSKGCALVKVMSAGICGSDIPRVFQTGTYHFPTILGHEFSGVVEEVFSKEDEKWLNKRVGVFPLIPCKDCIYCKEKKYEMCKEYSYLGSRCDGGFADYVLVPLWNLIEIPKDMGYEEAAMLEPAAVAHHAIKQIAPVKTDKVALLGLGTIGVILMQWLSYYGIKNAMAVGHHKEFGDLMQMYADSSYLYCNSSDMDEVEWIRENTNHFGADIVIDGLSTTQSIEISLEAVKPGGKILIMGNPKSKIELPQNIYWNILRKQLTLLGTWNSSYGCEHDDWNMVIKAFIEKKLHLYPLISHRLEWEKLLDGLNTMQEHGEYRNKVMISKEKY